jgi:hypothetical protein
VTPAQAELNLNAPPACEKCGGAFVWTKYANEDSKPPLWSGECPCGCEWVDIERDTPPTWRTEAAEDARHDYRLLIGEIDRLRAEVDELRAANERLAARAGGGAS